MMGKKKKYVKPMIVYCDFLTRQLRGDTEMIEKMERDIEEISQSYQCPAPDFCCYRGFKIGIPAECETEGRTYG